MLTPDQAIYEALLARTGEIAPERRLAPTRRVLDLLGHPEDDFEFIHVTGTNGKTSTSRIASSLLQQHGLSVGLFTSPHLIRFNERIALNGQPIDDDVLAVIWDEVSPVLEAVDAELGAHGSAPVTFFEALTCLAYTAFSRLRVDAAVVEVGMGGAWDSTNVADGKVAVITPIALDHMAQLGNTLTEIAQTKAGIIKDDATVVWAHQDQEVEDVLAKRAQATGSAVRRAGHEFDVTILDSAAQHQIISVSSGFSSLGPMRLELAGPHQASNAAVAIAAVDAFLAERELDPYAVRAGLLNATSPGRLQLIDEDPMTLIDAAHNPAGAAALVEALRVGFPEHRVGFVLSVLADKDVQGIIHTLSQVAGAFFVADSGSPRALKTDELLRVVRHAAPTVPALGFGTPEAARKAAVSWASKDPSRLAIITGSITLIGGYTGVTASRNGWHCEDAGCVYCGGPETD